MTTHEQIEDSEHRLDPIRARISPELRDEADMASDNAGDGHGCEQVYKRYAELSSEPDRALVGGVDLTHPLPPWPEQTPVVAGSGRLHARPSRPLSLLETLRSIAAIVRTLESGPCGLVSVTSVSLTHALRELPRSKHGVARHTMFNRAGLLTWASVEVEGVDFRAQYFEADEVTP